MTEEFFETELGVYRNKKYFLGCKISPSINDPKVFAAMITFFDKSTDKRIEIVRIDNAHGQEAHIHRLWRGEEDVEGLGWREEGMDLLSKALGQLQKKWEMYAGCFESRDS